VIWLKMKPDRPTHRTAHPPPLRVTGYSHYMNSTRNAGRTREAQNTKYVFSSHFELWCQVDALLGERAHRPSATRTMMADLAPIGGQSETLTPSFGGETGMLIPVSMHSAS